MYNEGAIFTLPEGAPRDALVAMSDGTYKQFSELKAGDKLLAADSGGVILCYENYRCMRDECPHCRGCCGCDGCGFDCGCLCS